MTGEPEACSLQQLAEYVGGRVLGDPRVQIKGIEAFERAEAGDLTLALEGKYRDCIASTRASAVIVSTDFTSSEKTLLQVNNPKLAFARLLTLFHEKPFLPAGVSSQAHIGRKCQISEKVTIHPFVHVEDDVVIEEGVTLFPGVSVGNGCVIRQDCVLHPNVVLYERTSLGRRVVLHGGTVIGADGYGYVSDGQRHVKIPQTGRVVIEDDVEIGANCSVDRATFGTTLIRKGVKLDNQVHIGHNCIIGENTLIVAQVGIAGSVEIGKNCTLAGHSGVLDQLKVGDQVTITTRSIVTKDVPSHSTVSGHPAMDHRQWMKLEALIRRLPDFYEESKASRRHKAGSGREKPKRKKTGR